MAESACTILSMVPARLALCCGAALLFCCPLPMELCAQDGTARSELDVVALVDAARRRDDPQQIAAQMGDALPEVFLSAHRRFVSETLSRMYGQTRNAQKDFLPFFSSVAAAVQADISSLQLQNMLDTYRQTVQRYTVADTRKMMRALVAFFMDQSLYNSGFHRWERKGGSYDFAYSTEAVRRPSSEASVDDAAATKGAPVLVLRETQLCFYGKKGIVHFPDTSGNYDLVRGLLYGLQSAMPWPAPLLSTSNPLVKLEHYTLDVFHNTVESYDAVLLFPGVLDGEQAGYFRMKMDTSEGIIPFFSSYSWEVALNLPYKGTYVGGLSIEKDLLQGRSHGGETGTLTIAGSREDKIVVTGKDFLFLENEVRAEDVSAVLYHADGYIDRGHLSLRYRPEEHKVWLVREKDRYFDMPFYASFFDMYFTADLITWDAQNDEVHISLISGREASSVHFQSGQYFSADEFRQLKGIYDFHPLGLLADYSREVGGERFTLSEWADRYGIDAKHAAGVVEYLYEHRFIRYQEQTEEIEILGKTWHYLSASKGERDYDRISIHSYHAPAPDTHNATLHTAQNAITLRGVERIRLGEGMEGVYVEPKAGEISMGPGKNFSFSGKVVTRTLNYEGEDFHFDYDTFTLDLNKVDAMTVQSGSRRGSGSEEDEIVGSFTETSGMLTMEKPANQAGGVTENHLSYLSKAPSTLYFDDPRVLGGVYDRSFKFVADGLDVERVNSQNFWAWNFRVLFMRAMYCLLLRRICASCPISLLGSSTRFQRAAIRSTGARRLRPTACSGWTAEGCNSRGKSTTTQPLCMGIPLFFTQRK